MDMHIIGHTQEGPKLTLSVILILQSIDRGRVSAGVRHCQFQRAWLANCLSDPSLHLQSCDEGFPDFFFFFWCQILNYSACACSANVLSTEKFPLATNSFSICQCGVLFKCSSANVSEARSTEYQLQYFTNIKLPANKMF